MEDSPQDAENSLTLHLRKIGEALNIPVSAFFEVESRVEVDGSQRAVDMEQQANKLRSQIDGAADSPVIRRILDALKR